MYLYEFVQMYVVQCCTRAYIKTHRIRICIKLLRKIPVCGLQNTVCIFLSETYRT